MSDMIEFEVSELEGAALDWAVAKAVCPASFGEDWMKGWLSRGSPSTAWDQGGPLIERYGVTIEHALVGKGDWHAFVRSDEEHAGFYADSPLIAAMRAIVAAELGETVQVPAELVEVGND